MALTWKHAWSARKSRNIQQIQDPEYFSAGENTGIFTLEYPHEKIPVPVNGRYQLHNEMDDCIVCDKCVKVCPVDCIEIDPIKATGLVGHTSDGSPIRLYAAKFDIDMSKCCFCGLCTTVCPTECFDNSKLQGTNPVSAMVCFLNGLAAKKEYRLFTPKTVEGPNDFATMYEVVTRRYKRLLEEESELPNLIIVDGGKGQLSSACDALKAIGLYGKIPIIGIAKRLEEIYFPEDTLPLYIDKKSESLKLIQQLRDEAHRFGITAHRNKRSKNFIVSQLEEMEGIGKLTAQKLLKQFGTTRNMLDAPTAELEKVIGKAKTPALISQLKIWLDEKN